VQGRAQYMDKKAKKIVGYKLHKNRIIFSGGNIIRTIKYPLVTDEKSKQFLEDFKAKVISDDRVVRGDVNLNDYLNYSYQGNGFYTLFDFWLDSLRAGVVWAPKSVKLKEYSQVFFGLKSNLDELWNGVNDEIKRVFDKEKFLNNFILKKEIRSTATRNSFQKKLKDSLIKDVKTDDEEVENLINSLVSKFFDSNGHIKLNGRDEQNKAWKCFGIDKEKIFSKKADNQSRNSQLGDITFLIIPKLISFNKEENEEKIEDLVEKRRDWLKNLRIVKKQQEDYLNNILGISENFNGFSNYFGSVLRFLKKGKTEEVVTALMSYLPQDDYFRNNIRNALEFLSQKAKKIPNVSMPKLVSGWADYRSVFGGKIQSWFSNFNKRQSELEKKLDKFKKSLSDTKKFFLKDERIKSKEETKTAVIFIERLESFSNKFIKSEKGFKVFETLLSALKKQLNLLYQQYLFDEKKEGDNVRKDRVLGALYQKIDKPIAFYAETQKSRNKKFIEDTISILEEGIDFLEKLIRDFVGTFAVNYAFMGEKRKDETEESVYRKQLQFLWNKWKDAEINSSEFKNEYKKLLTSVLGEKEAKDIFNRKNLGRYVFYKSKYAKGNVIEIKLSNGDEKNYLQEFDNLVKHLTKFLLSFSKDKLISNEKLLLDWLELGKNIISNLIRFNQKTEFDLTSIKSLVKFEKARNYIECFKIEKIEKKEYGFIIQSLLLAELRGAATLYSKKSYIASYSVQVIGSDNKFKLYYRPLENIGSLEEMLNKPKTERKDLVRIRHRYLISPFGFRKIGNKNFPENTLETIRLGKKKAEVETLFLNDLNSRAFYLQSSYYQLQFLDKYLYASKDWQNVDVELNEWSFAVEEAYRIKWNLDQKRPVFERDLKNRHNKLYLAIPFSLKSRGERDLFLLNKMLKSQGEKDKQRLERDKNRLNYPILGVDVGEYGLAWALVKFNLDPDLQGMSILGRGFIEDKNVGKIKDYYVELQQRSRLGTYDSYDTTIVRVRENAIGKLRNYLHAVLLNLDEGGTVVYEDSISNFETGSGKTVRIYNSVKRADTEFEAKADKSAHEQVWGKGTKYVGRALSAYASSYTCVNCCRSIYQFKAGDQDKILAERKEGNIVFLKTPLGEALAYSKNKLSAKSGKNRFKEMMKILKDFARPPLEKSEVIRKYVFEKGIISEAKINSLKRKRGNSAVFVCPFCQFVADADIQAALMMAIRGYLRFSGLVSSLAKTEDKSLEVKDSLSETGNSFLKHTIFTLEGIPAEDKTQIKETVKLQNTILLAN
jgi:hypothetical protein